MVMFLSIIILITSAYIIAILTDPSEIAVLAEACSGPGMCSEKRYEDPMLDPWLMFDVCASKR